jgi:hypothetical protein
MTKQHQQSNINDDNNNGDGGIRSKKQDDFDGASNIVLPCPGS